MSRTITAYFDTVAEAESAARDLATRVGGVRGVVYDARNTEGLGSLSLPQEDVSLFQEGFRRGGGIVHAEVPDHLMGQVSDVLEAGGAVDLDARGAEWRAAGWTAAPAAMGTTAGATTTGATAAATGRVGGEEVILVVEERLTVGKREVERGRVRIRSYTVETPVQESVTLRNERVSIERRAVDLPLSAADDAFRERTIEAVEHDEEAVVAKEARVREELVIRKDVEQRTETVSDTVRRTEVEIEDGRVEGAARATRADVGPTGTTVGGANTSRKR